MLAPRLISALAAVSTALAAAAQNSTASSGLSVGGRISAHPGGGMSLLPGAFIVSTSIAALLFAYMLHRTVQGIRLPSRNGELPQQRQLETSSLASEELTPEQGKQLVGIHEQIIGGAKSFLAAEYRICAYFLLAFGIVVACAASWSKHSWKFEEGGLTALAFVLGGMTSMASGYVGMIVAVQSNARVTLVAMRSGANQWKEAFNAAFRAGAVMGYSLTGISLLIMYALCRILSLRFVPSDTQSTLKLFEVIAGFGLGASSVAMFGRVGGGIYTKAADVGADLAGKVVRGLPEDDQRNPATIADLVGDNVGDVAGMGSDLFGSFAEATCAALVVSASSLELVADGWTALMFPLLVSSCGVLVCMACSFIATHIAPPRKERDVERVLKTQLLATTFAMSLALLPLSFGGLPAHFTIVRVAGVTPTSAACPQATRTLVSIACTPFKAYACVLSGLWAGCAIGFITEYYTSHSYAPTREVAYACETGAATNVIYGLALGYKSTVLPVSLLSAVVYISFSLADMYGVALAALGMLGTLACCLSIDVYGPICDNAGGIAEMSSIESRVRDCTDALDAAGNTTAAIGKGFAIGSAALVGLALFGAFVQRAGLSASGTSILSPMVFACLLLGAMVPYWFSAMTMKSVGVAAKAMVLEVQRQFDTAQCSLATAEELGLQVTEAVQRYARDNRTTPAAVSHPEFDAHLRGIIARDTPEDWNVRFEHPPPRHCHSHTESS